MPNHRVDRLPPIPGRKPAPIVKAVAPKRVRVEPVATSTLPSPRTSMATAATPAYALEVKEDTPDVKTTITWTGQVTEEDESPETDDATIDALAKMADALPAVEPESTPAQTLAPAPIESGITEADLAGMCLEMNNLLLVSSMASDVA
jgi:hypothetical protein